MTDYDYDKLATENDGDDDLVRTLRAAVKAANAERKQATKEAGELRDKVRVTDLSSLLKGAGVDPSVAQDMRDVEPTEDAVKAWLDARPYITRAQAEQSQEQPSPTTTTPLTGLDPALVAQLQAAQEVEAQGTSPETALGFAKLLEDAKEAQANGSEAFRKFMTENNLMAG